MKHRAFAPMFGLLAAGVLLAGATPQALAADPSGVWAKDDGSAKIEVKKCGRGLCTKIVWLKSPNNSRGKPLHDARNENPSMRDRPIMGMNLFSNMTQVDANTWQGTVYNPEEGKFYNDVKVTLASSRQIVLRGCKAWLLCGEKTWTRTSAPPPVAAPEPEQQIEANAPEAAPKPAEPVVEAAAKPAAQILEAEAEPASAPAPVASRPAPKAASTGLPAAAVEANAAVMDFPKVKSATTYIAPGMVTTSASQEPMPLTGDNVTSMMVMTKPAPVATAAPAEPAAVKPAPAAAPRREAVMETASRESDPAPAEVHRAKPRMQGSADAAPVIDAAEKPRLVKPKPAQPEERLPWLPPVAPRY